MSASSTREKETPRSTATGRKQLRRQPSRLQMHAPSSIEVAHPWTAAAAGWNIAIPLLSPIRSDDDAVAAVPWTSACETAVAEPKPTKGQEEDQQQQEVGCARWQTWRHPAIPFCYEAAPGNSTRPAFLLPHCA